VFTVAIGPRWKTKWTHPVRAGSEWGLGRRPIGTWASCTRGYRATAGGSQLGRSIPARSASTSQCLGFGVCNPRRSFEHVPFDRPVTLPMATVDTLAASGRTTSRHHVRSSVPTARVSSNGRAHRQLRPVPRMGHVLIAAVPTRRNPWVRPVHGEPTHGRPHGGGAGKSADEPFERRTRPLVVQNNQLCHPKPYHPKMAIRQRSSNGRAVRSAVTVEQDLRAWDLRTASLTYAQIGPNLASLNPRPLSQRCAARR
jgi:hypothetical protein